METNEVSLHQLKVFDCVAAATGWVTSKQVTDSVGISGRTVRAHLLKLVNLGLLDQAEVFPGHRYRLSAHAEKRNKAYLQRLDKAREVFGDCQLHRIDRSRS
jgi:predicted ArsR family transcriptional regulator